eukprot:6197635-Pleurochrysis_carterae.AAC.2
MVLSSTDARRGKRHHGNQNKKSCCVTVGDDSARCFVLLELRKASTPMQRTWMGVQRKLLLGRNWLHPSGEIPRTEWCSMHTSSAAYLITAVNGAFSGTFMLRGFSKNTQLVQCIDSCLADAKPGHQILDINLSDEERQSSAHASEAQSAKA